MKSNLVLCFLITIALSAGCTQKRQQIFAQGQGSNLEQVAAYQNQFVDIDTGDVIGIPSTTNAQDSVKISDQVKSMNHFDLVQLKVTNESLKTMIGSPPFRGKPNTHGVYQAQIKLTENYLKIMKVAKKEDLPFEEHFYIEETLEDGRVAIPLVGYKIKAFYNIEPEKTGDDQDSHHLIEVEQDDAAKATHVRIDWSSRELFEPIKKLDLFPADIFFTRDEKTKEFKPYEWYYSETVTEKSISDAVTIVGESNNQNDRSSLSPASKVIFVPREGQLRVVNVARDERLSRDQIQNGADLNSVAALILPVQWKDYRIKTEGSNLSFKGEEVEDRKWNQRQFFEADFPSLASSAVVEGRTSLLDIEVDQNYFSFTVMNMIGNQGRKIHYSFLRVDQGRAPYQPKASVEKDRNTFGFFTTMKPFIENWEYFTKKDYTQRIYMNRMNPKQKEIVFHLSSSSPKWLEDVAEMSVKAWDKTFADALGKDQIHITFSPERVVLGDLRYNVIHLVDTLNEDGLLGFGPSIADPESGEIISASTNVYVSSIQSIAADTVRQYMIDRIEGRISPETLKAGLNLGATSSSLNTEVQSLSSKSMMATRDLILNKKASGAEVRALLNISDEQLAKDSKAIAKHSCTYAQNAALSSNERDILNYCPEIEKIITANQGLSFTDRNSESAWEQISNQSKDAIRDCSKKITRGKLLSTLIHEIGHNFGLRHNFMGSYDKQNFKEVKSIFGETITARSSSIMEYTDWNEDRLTETGSYDVAAIRFGYGNAVELKDGSIVQVGQDSIETALSANKKQSNDLKPFMYCTDEEGYSGLNALCRPHDAGTSPKEIVQFYIDQYRHSEALRRFRRAKINVPSSALVGERNLNAIFSPMREIYDQWRTKLGEYVRKSNRYLTDYNKESYEKVLEGMKNDPQFSSVYAEYYDAANLVFDFFSEVAFGANQYCIVEDGGKNRAIEFVSLRDQLSEATRGATQIRNCAEAQSAADLAKILNASSPRMITEIGYPVRSYRYEKIENLGNIANDVLGNQETRIGAFLAINTRIASAQNQLNKFTPSMMDEPTLAKKFMDKLMERLVKGVDLSQNPSLKAQNVSVNEIQPLFNAEANLLMSGLTFLPAGFEVPGDELGSINQVVSSKKKAALTVYRLQQSDDPSQYSNVLTIEKLRLFAVLGEENTLGYQLISQYQKVDHDLSLKPVNDKLRTLVLKQMIEKLPAQANLEALTIADYITLRTALNKLEASSGDLISCLKKNIPALNQIDILFETLYPIYAQSAQQGDEAIAALVKNPLKAILDKAQQKEVLYSAEAIMSLPNLESASVACAQQQNETAALSKRYQKDFESQKSMILSILGMFSE